MLHSEFSWPVSGLRSYSRCALLLQAAGMEQVGGSGPAAVRRPNTTRPFRAAVVGSCALALNAYGTGQASSLVAGLAPWASLPGHWGPSVGCDFGPVTPLPLGLFCVLARLPAWADAWVMGFSGFHCGWIIP